MKDKKSIDTLQKISGVVLIVFSIFAVCLPIAGFSFDLGYLLVFGIDNNTFPRSVIELWQFSYFVSLKWLAAFAKPFTNFIYLYFAALFLLVLFGLARTFMRTFKNAPASNGKLKSLFGENSVLGNIYSFMKSCEMLFYESKGIWYTFLFIALTTIILYYLLVEPFQTGKEFARKSLDYYSENGCLSKGWSGCVSYTNPNNASDKSYNGLLVAASSSHIAIFDGSSVSVIPRKPEYVLVKTYTPKEKEKPGKVE